MSAFGGKADSLHVAPTCPLMTHSEIEVSRLEYEPEIVERRPHGLIVIAPVDLTDPSLRDTGAARTSFDQLLYRRGNP
jgi:hypothetical protein